MHERNTGSHCDDVAVVLRRISKVYGTLIVDAVQHLELDPPYVATTEQGKY